ncbi:drug/metabolite transporter (DMT)-like permease [Motilibacter rhizosphaerae]|uniref:Drug/metabolite transporter (DMT)-like permease n=1 Tax=Motilibacter rhizosphaerae TaxID=598652 RepID=A0A4Q7NA25_9ACTN|nr:drug/metabolite transporter (DMT)-like permease [Motilibacter rhizosphaerae]
MTTSSRTTGILAATATTVAWGGQFPIASTAFPHIGPVWISTVRYVVAGGLLLLLLVVREPGALREVARTPRLPRVLAYGISGFAGFNVLAYVGVRHSRPEDGSLIIATLPLVTAFVLWAARGVRPRPVTFGASALALLGLAFVLGHGDPLRLVEGGLRSGDLLVLCGALCFAVYSVGAATVPTWSPLRYAAVSAAVGALALLVTAFVFSAVGSEAVPTLHDLGATWRQTAYLALPGGFAAALLWNGAVRRLGPQDTSLFIVLVPVTTFVIQAFRGSVPGAGELVGVAITVAALAGGNLLSRRSGAGHEPSARRTGSSFACASATSASGSLSTTIPQPAHRRAVGPSSCAQRSARPSSPLPAASTQPTGPA